MRGAIGESDSLNGCATSATSFSFATIDGKARGKVTTLAVDIDIEMIE